MVALSRSARISLLLAIDVVFFFVELIVGKQAYNDPVTSC